ncbi:hypothetical protein [Methanospirillum hungatei]|nr:hypothetical protein [Methanospirillum hungatei]
MMSAIVVESDKSPEPMGVEGTGSPVSTYSPSRIKGAEQGV